MQRSGKELDGGGLSLIFVADGAADFGQHFRGNVGEVVRGFGVFGSLHQDIGFCGAFANPGTAWHQIIAAKYF